MRNITFDYNAISAKPGGTDLGYIVPDTTGQKWLHKYPRAENVRESAQRMIDEWRAAQLYRHLAQGSFLVNEVSLISKAKAIHVPGRNFTITDNKRLAVKLFNNFTSFEDLCGTKESKYAGPFISQDGKVLYQKNRTRYIITAEQSKNETIADDAIEFFISADKLYCHIKNKEPLLITPIDISQAAYDGILETIMENKQKLLKEKIPLKYTPEDEKKIAEALNSFIATYKSGNYIAENDHIKGYITLCVISHYLGDTDGLGAYGGHAGFTIDNNGKRILAKIDTGNSFTFAPHPDNNEYSRSSLIINTNFDNIRSPGTHVRKASRLANRFLPSGSVPNLSADIRKDLIRGGLTPVTYNDIKKSSLLYYEYCHALYQIHKLSTKDIERLITLPDEFESFAKYDNNHNDKGVYADGHNQRFNEILNNLISRRNAISINYEHEIKLFELLTQPVAKDDLESRMVEIKKKLARAPATPLDALPEFISSKEVKKQLENNENVKQHLQLGLKDKFFSFFKRKPNLLEKIFEGAADIVFNKDTIGTLTTYILQNKDKNYVSFNAKGGLGAYLGISKDAKEPALEMQRDSSNTSFSNIKRLGSPVFGITSRNASPSQNRLIADSKSNDSLVTYAREQKFTEEEEEIMAARQASKLLNTRNLNSSNRSPATFYQTRSFIDNSHDSLVSSVIKEKKQKEEKKPKNQSPANKSDDSDSFKPNTPSALSASSMVTSKNTSVLFDKLNKSIALGNKKEQGTIITEIRQAAKKKNLLYIRKNFEEFSDGTKQTVWAHPQHQHDVDYDITYNVKKDGKVTVINGPKAVAAMLADPSASRGDAAYIICQGNNSPIIKDNSGHFTNSPRTPPQQTSYSATITSNVTASLVNNR